MIKHESIKKIIDAVRIEDIASDFVTLKKHGSGFISLCPFHNEKTASFRVNPARNIFKCFGCGKGGDAITFLMEHERLSYPEALKYIAKKYSIDVEETELTAEEKQHQLAEQSLHIVNNRAMLYFKEQLETDFGKSVALSYLKSRNLRLETIEKWGIGFAPNNANLGNVLKNEQYDTESIDRSHLAKEGRDFFRNRIMFTIHSISGKPIAFAGRTMQKDVQPKYINSPETDVYNKSKTLYGLYFAKKAIQSADECILVEGYMDVISLHQAGIENVVATCGTSLTAQQIGVIKRFTQNVTILYDGDAAGEKATDRALEMLLSEDMNVKTVSLPSSQDPDSLVNELGANGFLAYLKHNAKDIIDLKAPTVLAEKDAAKRVAIIDNILRVVAMIPNALKRSIFATKLSQKIGISESVLSAEIAKYIKPRAIEKDPMTIEPTPEKLLTIEGEIELDELQIQVLKRYRIKFITRICAQNIEAIKHLAAEKDVNIEKIAQRLNFQQRIIAIRNSLLAQIK